MYKRFTLVVVFTVWCMMLGLCGYAQTLDRLILQSQNVVQINHYKEDSVRGKYLTMTRYINDSGLVEKAVRYTYWNGKRDSIIDTFRYSIDNKIISYITSGLELQYEYPRKNVEKCTYISNGKLELVSLKKSNKKGTYIGTRIYNNEHKIYKKEIERQSKKKESIRSKSFYPEPSHYQIKRRLFFEDDHLIMSTYTHTEKGKKSSGMFNYVYDNKGFYIKFCTCREKSVNVDSCEFFEYIIKP